MRHDPPFSRYLQWKWVGLADQLHAAATRSAWYVGTTLQVLPSSAEPGIIKVPGVLPLVVLFCGPEDGEWLHLDRTALDGSHLLLGGLGTQSATRRA